MIDRTVKARELFIKGEIDNDDYYAIKSNCENQIRKFADELKKAHSLSIKLKHKITDRTKLLSALDYFYWETDFNTKRKLIALLFKENLIFDEFVFSNNLAPPVCVIYGAQDNPDIVKNMTEKHQALTSLTDFENLIHEKICKIEQTSTCVVSDKLILEIMNFLKDFAKISISIYKETH